MPESWFELSSADQSESLEVAAGRSGRPAHLLEKDIWVVWALSAIYDGPLGGTLTFKTNITEPANIKMAPIDLTWLPLLMVEIRMSSILNSATA